MMQSDHPDHDPKDVGCLQALEMFYAYLDGELDPSAVEDFEHHMAHCRSCYSRAELERLVTRRLKAAAAHETPSSLERRLRTILDNL